MTKPKTHIAGATEHAAETDTPFQKPALRQGTALSPVTQDELPQQSIVERTIADLKNSPWNARTHSRKQVRQLAESLKVFGFVNPVLIDQAGRIFPCHGRLEAAKLLGRTTVPTIAMEHLTEDQLRAHALADNRLAELADWDEELQKIEFQYLLQVDLGFDLTVTGFDAGDIDVIIEGAGNKLPDARANAVPSIDMDRPALTQFGDVWLLGHHRLLCGDATKRECFEVLMAGARAQMVISDAPYNVRIDGHANTGQGAARHREFAMALGEMSEAEFIAFLDRVIKLLCWASQDGALHYLFMDWAHQHELLTAARPHYSAQKNLCVWNKTNGGMGSMYRSKHELVAVFKVGNAPHINNIELGRHGRYRTNVWDYPGMSSLGNGRAALLAAHPTSKPVELVADAILDASTRNGIVLDCFTGSGTILIAAERVGRRAYAMEIDAHYCDAAVRRWQTYTGADARHAVSGLTFTEIAERAEARS